MTVGQRIKLRRKEMGISADELGKRIGKNRATVFRYENGDIEKLPIDILKPIAEALLTTPQFLMGWGEDKKETATNNDSGVCEAKQRLLDLAQNCSDEDAAKLLQLMELFLQK
jgi:transcriptional regulator with XRE-family HTH domain